MCRENSIAITAPGVAPDRGAPCADNSGINELLTEQRPVECI